jgi:hypothetical protein
MMASAIRPDVGFREAGMNGWRAVLVVMLTSALPGADADAATLTAPTVEASATSAVPIPSSVGHPPQVNRFRLAQSDAPAKQARARRQPDVDQADQLSPRQLEEGQPVRTAAPADQPAPRRAQRSADLPRTIACNGVFGKDSSHLKLATQFDSSNVAFTEVDGPEGSRLMATVLFPNDPKRRLEVLWQDEAARTDTQLIVINGQSTWTAPKGLKLGLALAALEKLNRKPFKIAGFDQPNPGLVSDWQGGALETLPGDCRLGIRLVPDAKATEAARNEASGTEFTSSDTKMRAVRPIIAEIIIGY